MTDSKSETTPDDDPVRTAAYLRGFRNGLDEAVKICGDRSRRYRAVNTRLSLDKATATDAAASYISKAARKVEKTYGV